MGEAGRAVSLSETALRRHLVLAGFSKIPRATGQLSPVEEALHEIESRLVVDYAGSVAGRKAGVYWMNGKRVLVTDSPKIIAPDASVEWPLLRQVLEEALGHTPAQLTHLYGWIKVAYTALRTGIDTEHGPDAPGQAVVFAGPKDCGKSLMQDILREVVGGRSADPFSVITGKSRFTSDLVGAEMLMFGDQVSDTKMSTRRATGASIKQFTVVATQHCEGKGKDAVDIRPWRRLTMSVNDETENLLILPPFDDSIRDKIMLFKTLRPSLFDSEKWMGPGRAKNWAQLLAELPGFLHFIEKFSIPDELKSSRFGIREFHHPEPIARLHEASDELRLLDLIDTALFSKLTEQLTPRTAPWSGKSPDLDAILRGVAGARGQQAQSLLYFPNACGTFLSRLAEKMPERVRSHESNGRKIFVISPPPSASEGEPSK